MATPFRPLGSLKQALRQCRAERQCRRTYATAPLGPVTRQPESAPPPVLYPSLEPRKLNAPSPGFRPSQAIKQNRTFFLDT